ncbi:MAG: ribosome small subunit-dependent GTPase A [Planctomycetota bacterium]|nr:ribosome small subunit-dependent GTPase A [Planctomycetota bacterium]
MDFDAAALGWNAFFEQQAADEDRGARCFGRVVSEHKNLYRVLCAHGELNADLAGRLRHEALKPSQLPAVGDWVSLAPRPNEGRATIHRVFDRLTSFSRKQAGEASDEQVVAANIDTVFVAASLNADLNPRRLERYLALAWESGAEPVVLLTKADLCPDLPAARAAVEQAARGVPLVAVSALAREGLAALRPYLAPGKTCVLLGSSGVGKSTLVNTLAGREVLATRAIGDDDTGRHTTTHRQLVMLPGGGMIVDTPGMRELALTGGASLVQTFDDIEALMARCRFGDCAHVSEPGCAVKAAIEDGSLALERYESWQKLQRERAWQVRRTDASAAAAEKEKWKSIHRDLRAREKLKGKRGPAGP